MINFFLQLHAFPYFEWDGIAEQKTWLNFLKLI